MTSFRTIVTPPRPGSLIDHRSRISLFGSCFSDNMASRLSYDLFNVRANPLGTLYNPASIAAVMQRICSGEPLGADDIFCSGGLYHSYLCHSSLSAVSPEMMLHKANMAIEQSRRFLADTDFLFLTFGTAWVYELKSTGKIVANCHKQPSALFSRRLLTVSETAEWIHRSIDLFRRLSTTPSPNIILTVSPIRHLADGAHGNQISKSTLLLAIEQVLSDCPCAGYFPSYEIILDDLRDYRFYAADMCHPSEVAAEYVYDRLSESFFSAETRELARKCRRLTARLSHRVMMPDAEAAASFHARTGQLLTRLVQEHPCLQDAIARFNINSTDI